MFDILTFPTFILDALVAVGKFLPPLILTAAILAALFIWIFIKRVDLLKSTFKNNFCHVAHQFFGDIAVGVNGDEINIICKGERYKNFTPKDFNVREFKPSGWRSVGYFLKYPFMSSMYEIRLDQRASGAPDELSSFIVGFYSSISRDNFLNFVAPDLIPVTARKLNKSLGLSYEERKKVRCLRKFIVDTYSLDSRSKSLKQKDWKQELSKLVYWLDDYFKFVEGRPSRQNVIYAYAIRRAFFSKGIYMGKRRKIKTVYENISTHAKPKDRPKDRPADGRHKQL